MDDYTKRFWRDLSLAGLPFGSFFAISYSITRGWQTGIIIGSIMGLLFGLFAAYMNAREFAKPTYQLSIPPTHVSSDAVKSEFRLQSFFTVKNLIWVALALIIFVGNLFRATDTNRFLQALFIFIVIVLLFAWDAVRRASTHLMIAANGIKLVSMFYTLEAAWEDIAQIERRGQNWFIVCRSSKLTASPMLSRWLHYVEADKRISLLEFSSDFLKSELSVSLFYYGKQVKFVASQ